MRNQGCTNCVLHAGTTNVCVWGEGTGKSGIMLIGEAPGAEEEKTGRPFIGNAGKKLDEALAKAGLVRSDLYIANAVKCRPPNNRDPESVELDACSPYLMEEIAAIKPSVILCLGRNAATAMTGKVSTIGKDRGKPLTLRTGLKIDVPCYVTYHPAAMLHQGQNADVIMDSLVNDLRKAGQLAGAHVEDDDSNAVTLYPPVSDPDAMVATLQAYMTAPMISVDCEWPTGKNNMMIWPWHPRGELFSIALTARIDGRFRTCAMAWPLPPAADEVLRDILASRPCFGHNITSDLIYLNYYGYHVMMVADTMGTAFLIDETQKKALEEVAMRLVPGTVPWKGTLFEEKPSNDQDWFKLLDYNGRDTHRTHQVFDAERKILAKLGDRGIAIRNLQTNLLIPAIRSLVGAAITGVPVDGVALRAERDGSKKLQLEAIGRICDATGFAPKQAQKLAASPPQIKQFASGILGIELDNSRKDELMKIVDYPAIAAILAYRGEAKLDSTYLTPWAEIIRWQGEGNERLHTVYRPFGAETGRLSSELEIGGPLHTAPRNKRIRKLIKAEHGRKVVSGDQSQIELRMVAWQSGDKAMLQAYADDRDLHRFTAAYLVAMRQGAMPIARFIAEADHWMALVTDDERQGSKGVNFGLCFNMGEDKLIEYARVTYGVVMSKEDARVAKTGYFSLYPTVQRWQQHEIAEAQRLGYRETVFRRRRRFDYPGAELNAAVNFGPQSTANDINLLAMVQVEKWLALESLDAKLIGSVHDSIMFDVAEEHVERAEQIIKWTMENVDTSAFGFKIPVPLKADIKTADSWGG